MHDYICKGCGKKATELKEYIDLARVEGFKDANQAVHMLEGTSNPKDKTFYCTPCYIKAGMPTREY